MLTAGCSLTKLRSVNGPSACRGRATRAELIHGTRNIQTFSQLPDFDCGLCRRGARARAHSAPGRRIEVSAA